MMTGIRGASNAKASRELAWNPAHPSWREGFRGIDEQVATIVFATLAVSKWIEDCRRGCLPTVTAGLMDHRGNIVVDGGQCHLSAHQFDSKASR